MSKHYSDRFDRGEDFSEPLEIPDECQVCGNCIHFDKHMAAVRCMPDGVDGDVYYLRNCDTPHSLFHDMVEADSDASGCKHFAPDDETIAAIMDAEARRNDLYDYNGVNQRDFF